MVFPSTCILRVANSTPIVDFDSRLNSFRVNLESKLLLPTPESPMRTTGTNREEKNVRINQNSLENTTKNQQRAESRAESKIIRCE